MSDYTVNDQTFDELKEAAIKVWKGYDNSFGYVDEKLERIEPITNIRDNFGTLIGMFDVNNQMKMYDMVSQEGKEAIDHWTGGLLASYERAKQFGLVE